MTEQEIERGRAELAEFGRAYDQGYNDAADANAPLVLPFGDNQPLNGLYMDGYADRRDEMAKKIAKMTLLPAREADKFTKAADCIG